MNGNEIVSGLIALLVLIGVIFHALGALGIVRLPDVYLRSHAATKSVTLGVICILIGTFVYFWLFTGELNARIIIGIAFVFITAPVGGHLIGRAAYRSQVPLWEKSVQDDLKKKHP